MRRLDLIDGNDLDYISRTSRNLPTVSTYTPAPTLYDHDSESMGALERIKSKEMDTMKRIAEVSASRDISVAQTEVASEWLRNRAVGESTISVNTAIDESGRGFFGGVGKYLNVNTTVTIG